MRTINHLILLLLAAILLFSGVDKIFHYHGFVNALSNYVLVPVGLAPFLALPLVAIELAAGLGLLIRRWRRGAALLSAVALSGFTVALVANYFAGARGICGCWFTLTLAEGTSMHIAQNLFLAALAVMVVMDSRQDRADGAIHTTLESRVS